jgi:hypothetical protein
VSLSSIVVLALSNHVDRSYSRLVALEASRILFRLGCDVRVFDPEGLPVKNDVDHGHFKVQELRELSKWSNGHIWVTPEQHGNLVSDSQFLPGMNIHTKLPQRGRPGDDAKLVYHPDCRLQKSD